MESNWICPNDRHLALRAKLRSGWSVRTNQSGKRDEVGMTDEELEQIRNVINKASMLEQLEQERVGCLVHRLNIMRQNSMGDGKTSCILCAEKFGKFVGSAPIICMDCQTKVCNKCCVDYGTGIKPVQTKQQNQQVVSTNWLCKICSENRELWKRSGAWFFQALPTYKLPIESPVPHRLTHRPIVMDGAESTKSKSNFNSLAVPDSPASRKGHYRSASGSSGSYQWAKPTKPRMSSSSDGDDSSDDDGITLGKTSRASNTNLKSSDSGSFTSSTSLSVGQPAPVSGVSRQTGGRKSFRSGGSRSGSIRVRRNPKVQVSGDGDTVSIDSRSTEASFEDEKLMSEMSTLHGGSVGSLTSLRSEDALSTLSEKEGRGFLEFSVLYDPLKFALHVNVIRGKNLKAKDANGFSDPYVKLHLLPGASRASKLRTKTKSRTLDPVFDETLTYWGIFEDELATRQLLLTVLDEDRFSHNDFIGEVIVPLDGITPTEKKKYSLPLQALYALSEKDKTPQDPGRVHVGLCYHSQEHYLSVTIFRCSNLVPKNPGESVNAFARVTLSLDGGHTITHKTDVKRKTSNPVYDRELKFKVSQENGHAEVARGTLQISVFSKDGLGQGPVGSVTLGINSEGEKLRHWFNCLKNQNQNFDSWHVLTAESPKKKTKH